MEEPLKDNQKELVRLKPGILYAIEILNAGMLVLAGYSWHEKQYLGIVFLVLYAMGKKATEKAKPKE